LFVGLYMKTAEIRSHVETTDRWRKGNNLITESHFVFVHLLNGNVDWLLPPVSKICGTSIYNVVTNSHWSDPWSSGHCTNLPAELVAHVSTP
jgi:hypothetical protein